MFHILGNNYSEILVVLSPSLRPRQERELEDHRALAELEPDPKEMPAHSPMCLPLDCVRDTSWKAGHQGAELGFAPDLPYGTGE